MNALTSDQIIRLASEVDPQATLHPATIAYLQALVTPYADAVKDATIEGLRLWLPEAYKGNMGLIAVEEMNKKLTPFTVPFLEPEFVPEATDVARTEAIESLLAEIIEWSSNKARYLYSDIVRPWHVHAAIFEDVNFREMFGYPDTLSNEMQVEVTVGAKKYTFDLTMEFVAGLLLFSGVGNTDYNVTVFGAPFTAKDVMDYHGREVGSRFSNNDEKKMLYTVTVNGDEYIFNTPEFMQGFATGAQWAGVDHHAHWTNLTHEGNQITF